MVILPYWSNCIVWLFCLCFDLINTDCFLSKAVLSVSVWPYALRYSWMSYHEWNEGIVFQMRRTAKSLWWSGWALACESIRVFRLLFHSRKYVCVRRLGGHQIPEDSNGKKKLLSRNKDHFMKKCTHRLFQKILNDFFFSHPNDPKPLWLSFSKTKGTNEVSIDWV